MEYQKFIPEGWEETKDEMSKSFIQDAFSSGKTLQGYVNKCDSNYNLHLTLGNNINGIIPRNELEGINVDDFGFCSPNICKNKVNQFVQFKIKEIYDDNNVLLSRKNVQEEALKWARELKPGMVVNGIVKNMRKFRSLYRDWWRRSWITSYRRYFCIKNKISRRKIFYWTKNKCYDKIN